MAKVHHFHCANRNNPLTQLSYELAVPIWRLTDGCAIWRMPRFTDSPEAYGENIRYPTFRNSHEIGALRNWHYRTDCNNNAAGVNYSTLFVENNWSVQEYNMVENTDSEYEKLTAIDVFITVGIINRVFCKMEHDMKELQESFTTIVETMGENNNKRINISECDD